jgi:TRAP-type C4-dicarboxylate transport system permease small subunit
MLRILSAVPKLTVTALIILAIVNLLVGVILRYFVGAITDWLDVDPVPFMHRLPETAQLWIHRFNHALITAVGLLAAWYGLKLCLLNRTLTTPGLEINLAWLYASSVVGGILIAVYGFAMMISPRPQGEPQH